MGAYPNIFDVEWKLKTFPEPRPPATEIFADTYLVYQFLFHVFDWCWYDGHHEFVTFDEAKKLAESYVGRPIDDMAFKVGMRFEFRAKVKRSKSDPSVILVKLPPLRTFDGEQWKKNQQVFEKNITEEKLLIESGQIWR